MEGGGEWRKVSGCGGCRGVSGVGGGLVGVKEG